MKKYPKRSEKKTFQERNIQPVGLENNTSNTELLSNISKELINFPPQKKPHTTNGLMRQTFLQLKYKWPISMQKKKIYSTIREMQIRMTLRFYLIPVRMAIIS